MLMLRIGRLARRRPGPRWPAGGGRGGMRGGGRGYGGGGNDHNREWSYFEAFRALLVMALGVIGIQVLIWVMTAVARGPQ